MFQKLSAIIKRKSFRVLALTLLLAFSIAGIALAETTGGNDKFTQCANGGGSGPCDWINGIVQQSNSTYTEGDAVPQRVYLFDISGGPVHTLVFKWDTTKSGSHAYDYLVSHDYSEGYVNQVELCKTPNVPSYCTSWSANQYPIPLDPNIPPAVTQQAGNFTILNGTIVGVSPYSLSGSYAGTSETSITISFTTPYTQVLIAWGGHLALSSDWSGLGSATISGAPFHQALVTIDGAAAGSQDNQVKSILSSPTAVTLSGFTGYSQAEQPAGWNLALLTLAAFLGGLTLYKLATSRLAKK